MKKKEQEEFNNKIVTLLDSIVWNLVTKTDNKIRPDIQDGLFNQLASIKGLIQP